MAYLAFDRSRVAVLEGAMRDAISELWFVGCADPLAVSAVAALRDARRRLAETWLPMVHRVGCCDALVAPRPVKLDSDDLLDVVMRAMVVDHGWSVVDEIDVLPTILDAAWPPPSADEAQVLAAQLEDGHLGDLTDTPQERTWLATELGLIAADPALAAAFAASFTRWTDLIGRLGHERLAIAVGGVPWSRPDPPRMDAAIASVDAVDRGIAQVFTAVHGDGALPDLDKIDPYGAAAFVAQARLSPDALAKVSFHLLGRLTEHRPDGGWPEEHVRAAPSSADLLFAALLATPGSTTSFVIAAATDPQRMWRTPADPHLAQQVAASGTDPANIEVADAGKVLGAFIDYLHKSTGFWFNGPWGPEPRDSRAYLGNLVAPWLLQFSPFSDEWGTTAKDQTARRDQLKWVLGDHAAMDELLAAQQQIQAGLLVSGERSPADLTQYAGLVGMLTQLVVNQQIHDEEDRKHLWDTVWRVADIVISVALDLTPVGMPGALVIKVVLDQAYDEVVQQGWFNAPAPHKVRKKATYWQARTFVTVAATMVRSGYDKLITSGALPPGTPPPPDPQLDTEHPDVDYANRYRKWRDVQLADADPTVVSQLDEIKGYILSDAQAGAGITG